MLLLKVRIIKSDRLLYLHTTFSLSHFEQESLLIELTDVSGLELSHFHMLS